jgi:hypothetical protein
MNPPDIIPATSQKQSFQNLDEKKGLIKPVFIVSIFWTFFTFLLVFFLPQLVISNLEQEASINYFLLHSLSFIHPVYLSPALISLIPSFILISLIIRNKSVAKFLMFGLPLIVIFFAIGNFSQRCEELECMYKALMIIFPLEIAVCITAAVLPIAWIKLKSESTDNIFKNSFRKGLLVLIPLFLITNASSFPDYKEALPQIKATLQKKENLSQIKKENSFLSPVYLPSKILKGTKEEKEENGVLVTSFSCGPNVSTGGVFRIWQNPPGKKTNIAEGYSKEPTAYWEYTTKIVDRPEISGNQGMIIEKYLGAEPEHQSSNSASPNFPVKLEFQARQIVWETNNLQIIMGNEPFFGTECALPKEELVKIAESMKAR